MVEGEHIIERIGVERMANEEHLKILQQGVEVWNQWRKDNPEIEPDLYRADLLKAHLCQANLSGTNLCEANLFRANLREANLSRVNLYKAHLIQANLSKTNLCEANLFRVNLREVDLRGADLREADLTYALLRGADLRGTHFSGADIIQTDLSEVNLAEQDLGKTRLGGVKLSGVNFAGQDLSGQDLSGAILTNVSFKAARLINAKLDGANLTGSHLWETQRAGWSIKGVICEWAYWDEKGEQKTFYQPGDFERLFSEQNKIKLFYKDGANLLEIATLPSIIKNLEEKHPGCKLSFQSIEETSGGAIATLVLEESKDIAVEEVEAIRAVIQAEAERNIEAFRHALQSKDRDIAKLEGEVETLDRIINSMMDRLQPIIYNISGPVGAAGRGALAPDNTLNQIVNAENSSVGTQIQGDGNTAISDVSDSSIVIGDENNS
jgi:uncharacterized protein YjbI with pentapeptide repeats